MKAVQVMFGETLLAELDASGEVGREGGPLRGPEEGDGGVPAPPPEADDRRAIPGRLRCRVRPRRRACRAGLSASTRSAGEDIAAAVLSFVSDAACFVTGQSLHVSGGSLLP